MTGETPEVRSDKMRTEEREEEREERVEREEREEREDRSCIHIAYIQA